MKYLKKFESFTTNETLDMMFLPVDPIAGAADVYKDIIDSVKNKLVEITTSLRKASKSEVEKIKDFMMNNFGTTIPAFTEENAKKIMKSLGLDSIKENFKEGENLAVMICGKIKQVLGINMYAWAGIPLAFILGGIIAKSGVAVAAILLGSWALLWLFSKIMSMFGYGDEQTDVAGIGNYDPSKDLRNKFD